MSQFDYFVIFAEMRTGSNFLEANINAFPDLVCHGEAFNPAFVGYPKDEALLGVTLPMRENDPIVLLDQIKATPGALGGFRFFNDHDPRILKEILENPRCAKVILTRNPADSYISTKIARATGQWKLTNIKHAKSEQVEFDAREFEQYLQDIQDFQVVLLNALQRTGQTAFYIAYEDLQDLDIINGLGAYLGSKNRLDSLDKKLKKQNPEPAALKVQNFPEMEAALARLDRFNLSRTPNFEPRRGAVITTYVGAAKSPLVFMPVRSGPDISVRRWLCALDGVEEEALVTDFSNRTLRDWMKSNPTHRSFTVLRHPLERAHATYFEKILTLGPGTFREIRTTLSRVFKLPIPEGNPGPEYDVETHREAFLGFLAVMKANLSGQTGFRTDAAWATQTAVVQGFGTHVPPDYVLREEWLTGDLMWVAAQVGHESAPRYVPDEEPHMGWLTAIYTDEVEAVARDAYQKDYINFGFGPWKPPA